MKRFIFLLYAIVAYAADAQTINWYVDGEIYQTTTCESGNSITPPSAPVKHGYEFVGWYDENLVIGSGVQYGIPIPKNPIYPTFYQDGDLILRAVGAGAATAADTYNAETGKIIRRVGVKVLDGTETFVQGNNGWISEDAITDQLKATYTPYCTHFAGTSDTPQANSNTVRVYYTSVGIARVYFGVDKTISPFTTATEFKQWLADQYNAGTPVTVYYPLATPIEETYTPAQ